jgi:hypothetical protein
MDPISAKLTSSALQNVGQQQGLGSQEPTFQTDKSSFAEMLDNQFAGATETSPLNNDHLMEMVDSLIEDPNAQPFNTISGQDIQIDIAKAGEVEGGSAFKTGNLFQTFKEINTGHMNLERVMETLQSGKKFSTAELLRLQTLTHMYSVKFEIFGKMGEAFNQGIRKFTDMQIS